MAGDILLHNNSYADSEICLRAELECAHVDGDLINPFMWQDPRFEVI